MADQLTELVKRMQAEGVPESDIVSFVQQFDQPVASHEPDPGTPEHPHARTWRLVKENLPAIGAGGAVALTGPAALIPAAIAAGLGGAGGYGVQQTLRAASGEETDAKTSGDVLGGMALQGGKEGAIQLAGGALVKGGGAVARGLMKGTVPKNIAKDFAGQVDIPREMLKRNVVPGVPASARRVSRLSTAANAERDAAAATVPMMPRSKVMAGLRPEYAQATLGREPKLAGAVVDHMRESARNIGPDGLSGPAALARKDIQQRLSSAAINNPQTAAIAPQLHNAERGAIVSHLRETPRMATALDESQALMAIDQVMKDAALSNPVTRMRIGGLPAGALSPVGLGLTAHGINKATPAVSPNMLRALQIALLSGEQE